MYIDIKQYHKLRILFFLIFINDKIFAFGNSNEEKGNSFSMKECTVFCEEINSNSKNYLTYLKNIITATDQNFKKCALLLNKVINSNKTWERLDGIHKTEDSKINFLYINNSLKLNTKNTIVLPMRACRSLMKLISNSNRTLIKFQTNCGPKMRTCQEKEQIKRQLVHCTEGKWKAGYNVTFFPGLMKKMVLLKNTRKFHIINEEPEHIDVSLTEGLKMGELFLWYASYANTTTPRFECSKILRQNFTLHVTPNVNYLICLAAIDKYFLLNVFDCQPFKTKPQREDQPLLVKKSIPTLIISLFVLFVLAMAMGASLLYLSIHKNPSLIRGVKRVIEVKRQDKAHILIMPRGYENLPQAESPLALSRANGALEPAISTLSCDTNSTISYVSANQPTPVEILTYRLNRLRELYQSSNNSNNNSIPQLVSSIPMSFSMSLNQRLPPNVDLLLEYEWYTITTTIITTTTTTTTTEDE